MQFSVFDAADGRIHMAMEVPSANDAIANLQPGLEKIDAALMTEVVTQFDNVDAELAKLRDSSALGGYITWNDANRAKYRKTLSQAVLSLQQPMQKIAEKVATAQ